MSNKNLAPPIRTSKKIFWLFFGAAIPAYFLSALWLPIPGWIYALVVLAAFAQCAGFAVLLKHVAVNKKKITASLSKQGKLLWLLGFIAIIIKLLLQLVSVIPSLSQLTVGFRPIVIGYLHLVLLGVITIFLIGYFVAANPVQKKLFFTGVTVFVAGIFINEILLMLQGATALTYTSIPFVNEMLFVAALIMFSGLLIVNLGFKSSSYERLRFSTS